MEDNRLRIAVDCGHGANTAGKRTPKLNYAVDFENDGIIDIKKGGYIHEHVANVRVGKFLVQELKRCGFEVFQSAFGDEDISIANRQKNIKNAKCDLSVSIHFNAYGDGKTFNSAQGIEVFYHSNNSYIKDSKAFAMKVLNQLIRGTEQKNRGVKTQALGLCNCSAMNTKASILVELGFMTNEREAKLMGDDQFLKECAVEIAKGICDYTGKSYIAEKTQNSSNTGENILGYVKVLVNDLNIRNKASWADSAVCGTVKKNEVFTIDEKITVGNGAMYKLKSGVYITASEKYVKYLICK